MHHDKIYLNPYKALNILINSWPLLMVSQLTARNDNLLLAVNFL